MPKLDALRNACESASERKFLQVCANAGLVGAGWRAQHKVRWRRKRRPYRLDFAIPALSLAFEVDGPHHREPEQKAFDGRRDEILANRGWRVVRFPSLMAYERPERVVEVVRAWIVARAPERRAWCGGAVSLDTRTLTIYNPR